MLPVRSSEVVIVGAGVSGLSLARALRDRGVASLVLERARGVGGRCATRRVEGRPVDHGLPFLHGRDPDFLRALADVTDATPLPGWPVIREGHGLPCQPEAFEGRDTLLAFQEGLTRFPKHLARGLDLELGARVVGVSWRRGRGVVALRVEDGPTIEARHAVLTMPAPQARALLGPVATDAAEVAALLPLLDQIRTIVCLAVIAVYPDDAPRPRWDACYPATSTMVHAILNDTSKRGEGPLTLVVQGRPRFSRETRDEPPSSWAKDLLWEAGEFIGPWVERPAALQTHVWEHARVEHATELTAPLLATLPDGATISVVGDGFAPGGGVEGAFLAGRSLARRIETSVAGAAYPERGPSRSAS
ncbi:MAG: NAD(P)/FAD-dependent oxidoreductase [Hyphomicrobiales bacterium]